MATARTAIVMVPGETDRFLGARQTQQDTVGNTYSMRLLGKPLSEIRWEDLLALVDAGSPENIEVDYKESLPDTTDAAKRKFLADVSAMANSLGGLLLYGIREARDAEGSKTDLPEAIVGVPTRGIAEAKLRLATLIRAGLDPPLDNFLIEDLRSPDGTQCVLAVGIPRSIVGPHAVASMIIPIWRRIGSMNYTPRTSELRSMFLERDRWTEAVESFRAFRSKPHMFPRPGPQHVVDCEPACMLHVLPLGRMQEWIDLVPHKATLAKTVTFSNTLHPLRPNADGFCRTLSRADRDVRSVQWFRFGGVEIFLGELSDQLLGPDQLATIESTRVALVAVETSMKCIVALNDELGVGPPYAILLSLFHTSQRAIPPTNFEPQETVYRDQKKYMTVDHLSLPAVIAESVPPDINSHAILLRQLLDAVWQAGGVERCSLYEEDGQWRGREIGGWQWAIS